MGSGHFSNSAALMRCLWWSTRNDIWRIPLPLIDFLKLPWFCRVQSFNPSICLPCLCIDSRLTWFLHSGMPGTLCYLICYLISRRRPGESRLQWLRTTLEWVKTDNKTHVSLHDHHIGPSQAFASILADLLFVCLFRQVSKIQGPVANLAIQISFLFFVNLFRSCGTQFW